MPFPENLDGSMENNNSHMKKTAVLSFQGAHVEDGPSMQPTISLDGLADNVGETLVDELESR